MRRSAIRVFVGTINAIRRVQRCIEGCPRLTLFADNRISVVVLDRHTNRGRVDVAVAENEESTEDGLSDAIEDTVKDCLRVRGDDVTTFTKAPGDRIQSPQESGKGTAKYEASAYFRAIAAGVAASFPDQLIKYVEESNAACVMLEDANKLWFHGSYQW